MYKKKYAQMHDDGLFWRSTLSRARRYFSSVKNNVIVPIVVVTAMAMAMVMMVVVVMKMNQ